MAIKFQFNKTALQKLNKDLKVRENALPTLQAKESALRNEVKRARGELSEMEKELESVMAELASADRMWHEFPDLLDIDDVKLGVRSIAGVKAPYVEDVTFTERPFSLHANPHWFPAGINILKKVVTLRVKVRVAKKKVELLEYARKKTTQKVNLYEKVQIPGYKEAILKIKRFLEDEENLAKSSQKILKSKLEQGAAA